MGSIYMKFGNIVGDATQHVQTENGVASQVLRLVAGDNIAAALLGETDWIPLKSFDWHGERGITSRTGKGSPSQIRGPVAPTLHEIVVDKDVDGSSCDLLQKFNEDKNGVDCTIVFIRTGEPGEIYLQYKLKNTLIKEIHINGKDERPNEKLTLNFTEMELTVWRADQHNVAPGPSRYKIEKIEKDGSQQGGGHVGHGGDHGHGSHH